MFVIEVEGIEVRFDLEQLIDRIDGIENCLQLVLMEIGNYLLETRQCAKMMEIRKIERNYVKINHINSAIYQKLACWVVLYSRNFFPVCFCLIQFLTVLGLRIAEPFFKFVDVSRHCCKWNWCVLKARIFFQEIVVRLVSKVGSSL